MATAALDCSPETLFDDPYPFYAELRRDRPVHLYAPTREWFVTRWSGIIARRAARSFSIGGVTIPEGAQVALVASSANRDESRWEDAEHFRLDRARRPHAAFGYQPHFCSGHYLVRQIGRIVLEECFAVLTGLRLDPAQPVSIKGWRFRGVVNLPAIWTADAVRRAS